MHAPQTNLMALSTNVSKRRQVPYTDSKTLFAYRLREMPFLTNTDYQKMPQKRNIRTQETWEKNRRATLGDISL